MWKKYRFGDIRFLIPVGLLYCISAACTAFISYFMKFITDFGMQGDLLKSYYYAKLLFLFLGVEFITNMTNSVARSIYLNKSNLKMKNAYIDYLLKQDITQIQKDRSELFLSNLTNDFDRYEEKFTKNVILFLSLTTRLVATVILLGVLSLKLVILALVLIAFFLKLTMKTSEPIQKTEEKKSESLTEYTGFVKETLEGFEIIKGHGMERHRYEKFLLKAKKVQDDNYLVDVKSTKVDALNGLIQMIILFGLILAGIVAAKSFEYSLGNILVVMSSFASLIWPLEELSPLVSQMKGIGNILKDFEKNLKRPEYDRPLRAQDFHTLKFINCDLGYQDGNAILEEVDLELTKGDKILIIGPSGSGKSTILKTLRQSIMPKEGNVFLDEKDIFKIAPEDYYHLFANVDQVGFLFAGSIYDNVTMYQQIDIEKVKSILKRVGLLDLDLQMQLKNNGLNISGGQRARLLLARAICMETKVILCDEIFASLNQETAFQIEEDLLKLDCSIINISHIYFRKHLTYYTKVYLVEDGHVKRIENREEIEERMLKTAK